MVTIERDRNKLFNKIINYDYLRRIIFNNVKTINLTLRIGIANSIVCNWDLLACFPDQLIKYKYFDRYKNIFNILISNNHNNNESHINNESNSYFIKIYIKYLKTASSRGYLDIIEFIYNSIQQNKDDYSIDYKKILEKAIIHGHLSIVEFIHNKKIADIEPKIFEHALELAAAKGHLAIVEFIHNNRTERVSEKAMNDASMNGHLDIVRFLHNNRTGPLCTTAAMDLAARSGHLTIVEYLHNNRSEGATQNAMTTAAAEGHLHVVQFLDKHRKEGCTTSAMDFAAKNGHFEVVKYLHTHRTEGCTDMAVSNAARMGNLEMVEYLLLNRTEGCKIVQLNLAACRDSHLPVIQFLHRHYGDKMITSRLIETASMYGCIEIIKWIHNTLPTAPFTVKVLEYACKNNYSEIIRFIVENRTEDFRDSTKAMDDIAFEGNFEIFKYLYNNGFKCTGKAFSFFARYNNISPLVWMKDTLGIAISDIDSSAYFYAAEFGNINNLLWLSENYPNIRPDHMSLQIAAAKGYLDVVKLLLSWNMPYGNCIEDAALGYGDISVIEYLYESNQVSEEFTPKQLLAIGVDRQSLAIISFVYKKFGNDIAIKSMLSNGSKFVDYPTRLEFITSNKL